MKKWAGITTIICFLLILTGCGGTIRWGVLIKTDPADADVYADEKYVCKTPCVVTFERDPVLTLSKRIYSPNKIKIKKDGYKEINRIYTTGYDLIREKGHSWSLSSGFVIFDLEPLPSIGKSVKSIAGAHQDVKEGTTSIPALNIPGQRWALVIGISNYRDSRVPILRYAASDAKAFHDWLVSPAGGKFSPANVRLIVNEEATGQNMKDALFNWLGGALAEDLVTIYFAGHGGPQSPDQPGNLFLLPYDTQYDNIASSGFPMWDIETALKRFIKARKVIVIADACHSGGVGQAFDVARRGGRGVEVNPINAGLQSLSQVGDGIAVISASDEKQFSQEGMQWGGGHGVFTYHLLKGLKGDADYNGDKQVTLGELIPYLSEKVRRETRNAQSPIVSGKFDPALSIGR